MILGPNQKFTCTNFNNIQMSKSSLIDNDFSKESGVRERARGGQGAHVGGPVKTTPGLPTGLCESHEKMNDLSTPRFLIYDLLTNRKSSILGIWAAPGDRETLQKGGGRRPPSFWKVSRPPGAAQTPTSTISRRSKNHILKTPAKWP